ERVRRNPDFWRTTIQDAAVLKGDGILEGPLELDIAIRAPGLTIVADGRYLGDIPPPPAWLPERDHIARYLDALLDLAAPEDAGYFLLLTDDYAHQHTDVPPMAYEALIPRY